jgi:hypothetical protein
LLLLLKRENELAKVKWCDLAQAQLDVADALKEQRKAEYEVSNVILTQFIICELTSSAVPLLVKLRCILRGAGGPVRPHRIGAQNLELVSAENDEPCCPVVRIFSYSYVLLVATTERWRRSC